MLNRAIEENHLRQARSHVVAATARIANQCLVISQLRARGLDTRQAEACLHTMQQTLGILRAHKELIESILAKAPMRQPPLRQKEDVSRSGGVR